MKQKKTPRNIRSLALEVGYTPAMMSHILNCIRSPSLTMAIKLEQVTGITVEVWASKNRRRIAGAFKKWKASRES